MVNLCATFWRLNYIRNIFGLWYVSKWYTVSNTSQHCSLALKQKDMPFEWNVLYQVAVL